MEPEKRFQNRTVLITGGASGMGFLSGKCFAAEGANVVLCDVNAGALEKCVAEIRENSGDVVLGVVTDVTDYAACERARDAAVERFGSIDVLLNYAGGAETRLWRELCGGKTEFHEIPIEVYDRGLELNLKGVLHMDHAVLAQMARQNSGVILHIGSITGQTGSPNNVSYAAAKSALMTGVTKSIAQAGAGHSVRCLCVAPGPVLTRPGMAAMKTLMGRAAEPQEIVDLVLYFASDKAAFATGSSFLIDGGTAVMI